MFRFSEHLDEAVEERCEPQEPFKASHDHNDSNDTCIYDLQRNIIIISTKVDRSMALTSWRGHDMKVDGILSQWKRHPVKLAFWEVL